MYQSTISKVHNHHHHQQQLSSSSSHPMSVSGIQGQLLEVTVVACNKLKDTEWISRQDPYVCLEYGSTKFRTRTCTDGGKYPTFQEKFVFTLIEGLRELNVVVWNSNTLSYDDFIGNGKVQLHKVLMQGYDDSPWSLQTKTGRYAGEVRLILHYASANKPSASPYMAPPSMYPAQPPVSISGYSTSAPPSYPPSYPPSTAAYPPQSSAPYPPQSSAYPPQSSAPYPPQSSAYPPQSSAAYPPAAYPPQPTAYPPQPYPPHSVYPPPAYPPPPNGSSHYPPGPFPGLYPPPHY